MTDRHGGRRKYLVIAVGMAGVSTSPLFYRLAYATGLNALWVNVFRLLITAAVMAVIALSGKKRRHALFHVSKKTFWISALAGTLLALHLDSWALSLVYTDSYAASTILGIYVLLTVLFASLILKEKTSKGALGGLIVATAGVVVCNLGAGFGGLSGNMLALFAAVTEALYILCGRKVRGDTGAVAYTTILYAFAFFWMLIFALFTGIPERIPADGVLWAGMLTLFSTLFGHSMANVALRYFKAATVSAFMMTGTIFGPLVVLIFLGEKPTLFTFIGGSIIVAGIAFYMAMERREAMRMASAATAGAEDA